MYICIFINIYLYKYIYNVCMFIYICRYIDIDNYLILLERIDNYLSHLSTFLIFSMKLKGYKVTEPDFWNKFLIWRYSGKRLQISPKSNILIFFSKTALMIFLVFGLKLILNMTFDLVLNWIKITFQKKLLFGDIWP